MVKDGEEALTRDERAALRSREAELTKAGARRRLSAHEVSELNAARVALFGPAGRQGKAPAKRSPGKIAKVKRTGAAPTSVRTVTSGGLPSLGKRH